MEKEITTLQRFINVATEFLVNYSFQIIGAIIILLLGSFAANWAARFLMTLFEKKKMDITLAKFLASTVKVAILIFAGIIALGKFGITITPFIAALSAMAFGASFAIQGPLSNYGAGLAIILSRPFVVGDSITVAGISGVVKEIKLSGTILTGRDGVEIRIPNKHIDGEIIHNSKTTKAAECIIGISYDSSPEAAIQAIERVLAGFKTILNDPKPQIGIRAFGDSSVNIEYHYWASAVGYAETVFGVNLAVYKALQKANINIPFPQREIRILSQPSANK